MVLLFADENFRQPIVVALRHLGYDVVTAREAGLANQGIPDDAILQHAIKLGRAVVTHNRRDFVRLHSLSPAHAGIIACTPDPDAAAAAARIQQAVGGATDLAGQLLRVNLPAKP